MRLTGWRSLAPAVLTVGTAMVVLIPAIDTFFQFAQPRPGNPGSEILPTVAVPVLLVALGIQLALVYRLQTKDAATECLWNSTSGHSLVGPNWGDRSESLERLPELQRGDRAVPLGRAGRDRGGANEGLNGPKHVDLPGKRRDHGSREARGIRPRRRDGGAGPDSGHSDAADDLRGDRVGDRPLPGAPPRGS